MELVPDGAGGAGPGVLCCASSLFVPVPRVTSPFIVMISFPPLLYLSSVPPRASFGPSCASVPLRSLEPHA